MEGAENIYPDECKCDGHSESSLFENMIGFEEFNPVGDTAINTIFDELQEGTLLSILKDELFVDLVPYQKGDLLDQQGEQCVQKTKEDIDVDKFSQTSVLCSSSCQESNQSNTCSMMQCHEQSAQGSQNDDPMHLAEQTQMDCTSYQMTCKRIKHGSCEDSLGVKKEPSHIVNPKQLLEYVQHDHCYVGSSRSIVQEDADQKQRCLLSERSSRSASRESLEEGSNSDPGYDTMSVTTSPGTSGSNEGPNAVSPTTSPPPQVTLRVPSLPPLGEHTDPVALIDARIKHFMCCREVNLTEEEKETLKAEGLPIPTTLPLTKAEEKVLRNVRRKIRNKVAAQQSRKRKKEHLCTLEQRIKEYGSENLKLKKRVEILESENKKLLTQVKEFQMLLTMNSSGGTRRSTQMGACLMILALCFAVIIGGMSPKELWSSQQSGYTTSSVRSRALLSLEHQTNIQSMACHWFNHIFVSERDYPGTSYISAMCSSQHGEDVNKCTNKGHLQSSVSTLSDKHHCKRIMNIESDNIDT